jgi:hypothetical protein
LELWLLCHEIDLGARSCISPTAASNDNIHQNSSIHQNSDNKNSQANQSTQHYNNALASTTIVHPVKTQHSNKYLLTAGNLSHKSHLSSSHFNISIPGFFLCPFRARQSHLLCLGFSQFTMVPRAPIIALVLATSSLLSPWPILMGQLPILPWGRTNLQPTIYMGEQTSMQVAVLLDCLSHGALC